MVNGTSSVRAERLGQERLAAAGRPDQEDVRLLQLDVAALGAVRQALVVVVHRHAQDALGLLLPDHVVVQHPLDLRGGGHAGPALDQRALVLLADDIGAELDALVADEHGRARDQLAHLVLALTAERAVERVLGVAAGLGHRGLVPMSGVARMLPGAPQRNNRRNPRRLRPDRAHGGRPWRTIEHGAITVTFL